MPFLLNIKSDYKICQNCYLFNVHFRSLLHIFASFFCSLILFYPDSSPNSIKSESKVERIGLERVKSCNRSPEPVHGIEERHERTNERTRAQAPTNSRKKRDPPPWNPFISTLEEKEALSSNLRPPLVPTDPTTLWIRSGVLRSASARANSSSRTRVQLLSSLFLQLAFIRAARFNSGCGAPRAKSGNARGKLLPLSFSLSLSFAAWFCAHRETRRVSSGITQLCKAGGVPSSCDR